MQVAYIYDAEIVSVYDADTIRMDIDLGMNTWVHNEPIRVRGIDAPEVRGVERPEGLKARDFVREVLPPGSKVLLETYRDKKGKYGRYVADVYFDYEGKQWSLAELLCSKGMADIYPSGDGVTL